MTIAALMHETHASSRHMFETAAGYLVRKLCNFFAGMNNHYVRL